jgi:hypothetical protein
MKRLYILLTALLVTVTAFAQSGKELYQKYSDLPEVSAVYVSPSMFRIIGRLPEFEVEDESVDLAPIIRTMTGFYLISCEDGKVSEKLYSEVTRLVDKGKYELIMEAKEGGEATRIYSAGSGNEVMSLVMLTRDGNEVTFLGVDGRMDRDKLENILAEAAK